MRALVRFRTLVGTTLVLSTCSLADSPTDAPTIVLPPALAPWRRQSFVIDVDRRTGDVHVTHPVGHQSSGASLSLVGGDVIAVAASNFAATTVGAGGAPPGKVLVTFDLALINQLAGLLLIRPTFPAPPTPDNYVYLIPLEAVPTVTSGTASGSGDDLIVELPNHGSVLPSSDFDGAGSAPLDGSPHNFFNDASCGPTSDDCFRYEAYPAPIRAGATAPQRVGFVVDPTVANFRARLLVAADLLDAVPMPVSVVYGSVVSPILGAIAGASVALSQGSSTITDAGGFYAINARLQPGTYQLRVSGVPPSCTAPPPIPVLIQAGLTFAQAIRIDVTVDCPFVNTFPVAGTVNFASGGPVAGAAITLARSFTIPPLGTLTAADGSWSFPAVTVLPTGSYALFVTGLPVGCAAPNPLVPATGPSAPVAITVTCGLPFATVNGTATFAPGSSTPPLSLVEAGGLAQGANLPVAGGGFSFTTAVGSGGTGSVPLTGLPTGCASVPTALPYAGLSAGGSLSIGSFSIDCVPTAYYVVHGEWNTPGGGTAELTLWIDASGRNDPANNGTGPDVVGAYQLLLVAPATRLTPQSCTPLSGFGGIVSFHAPEQIVAVETNVPLGASGSRVDLMRCVFTVRPGPPVRLLLTNFLLGSPTGLDLTPFTVGAIDELP